MTNLTELVIADNNLESKDCRHLARLTGLERLNALGASIGATGCRHMAALSRLTALNLNGNQDIGDTGAKVIAGSLKQLHVLEVANCYIQIDGEGATQQVLGRGSVLGRIPNGLEVVKLYTMCSPAVAMKLCEFQSLL